MGPREYILIVAVPLAATPLPAERPHPQAVAATRQITGTVTATDGDEPLDAVWVYL